MRQTRWSAKREPAKKEVLVLPDTSIPRPLRTVHPLSLASLRPPVAPVNLGLEDANERQPPVPLVVVQPVADHECIRHLETRIVNPHRHPTPGWLVQQRAHPD